MPVACARGGQRRTGSRRRPPARRCAAAWTRGAGGAPRACAPGSPGGGLRLRLARERLGVLLRLLVANERLVVLAPDERLDALVRDVVVDLDGRGLHEVAGRRDERAG